jgi:hypothetical protein
MVFPKEKSCGEWMLTHKAFGKAGVVLRIAGAAAAFTFFFNSCTFVKEQNLKYEITVLKADVDALEREKTRAFLDGNTRLADRLQRQEDVVQKKLDIASKKLLDLEAKPAQ